MTLNAWMVIFAVAVHQCYHDVNMSHGDGLVYKCHTAHEPPVPIPREYSIFVNSKKGEIKNHPIYGNLRTIAENKKTIQRRNKTLSCIKEAISNQKVSKMSI